MSKETLEVGDLTSRSIYKNGYWVRQVKARILAINNETQKAKIMGVNRPVWVRNSTLAFITT